MKTPSPPVLFELIRHRKTCRSYEPRPIDPVSRNSLMELIASLDAGMWNEPLQLRLMELEPGKDKRMRLDYGLISGHSAYLLGIVADDTLSRVSYGFQLEKVVLHATALGLSTCWVGYFDSEHFSQLHVEAWQAIPSIVVVGHGTYEPSIGNRLLRFSFGADKRLDWDKLFFNADWGTSLTAMQAGPFCDALEMVRLAPSSGNTQPWRILRDADRQTFHFFKKPVNKTYEQRGLHDVDIGIAAAHFDLYAQSLKIPGTWQRIEAQKALEQNGLQYMCSWVG